MGLLFGYKAVLQGIALLLAFSIRKGKVKGLDEAKYIGTTVYMCSLLLTLVILVTYTLEEFVNIFLLLCFALGLLLVATAFILILPLVS